MLLAIHPIHTEAVAGLVGRADALAGLFFVGGLLVYDTGCRDGVSVPIQSASMVATGALAVAAMLCKETGVTMLGVCGVMDAGRVLLAPEGELQWSRLLQEAGFISRASSLFGMLCVILYVRVVLVGSHKQGFQWYDNPLAFEPHLLTRILSQLHLYTLNTKLMLFPNTLCCDYTVNAIPHVRSIMDSRNLLSCGWVFSFGSMIRMATHPRTRGAVRARLAVCLSMVAFPFLPASNIFFPVGFVLAERVLYIPSMGMCLLTAMGLDALQKAQGRKWLLVARGMCFAVLIALSARTLSRNGDWRNEETLFGSGMRAYPTNARMQYNYGLKIHHQTGDGKGPAAALKHYRLAVAAQPNHAEANIALGRHLMVPPGSGEPNARLQARKYFQEALHARPSFADANLHLALVLDEPREVVKHSKMALITKPDYPEAHFQIAHKYHDSQPQEALKHYEAAIQAKPVYPIAALGLGQLLHQLAATDTSQKSRLTQAKQMYKEAADGASAEGDRGVLAEAYVNMAALLGKDQEAESRRLLTAALKAKPDYAFAYNKLGMLASDPREARALFQTGVQLQPRQAEGYFLLGLNFHTGTPPDTKKAAQLYREALRHEPSFEAARNNLAVISGQRL